MSKEAVALAVVFYNMIVVIGTVVGIYYISGWMFFLLMALIKYKSD